MTDTAKSARESAMGAPGDSDGTFFDPSDPDIIARSRERYGLAPAVGGVSEEARVAGAKVLAHTLRMKWEGLYPGKIDGYPAWKVGGHYNAHQGDYCDLAENIFNAMLPYAAPRLKIEGLREAADINDKFYGGVMDGSIKIRARADAMEKGEE